MPQVCRDIDETITEQVSKPVEQWENRQERRCKDADCNWWTLCLNKVFCWFIWIVVKVVRIVVETVVRVVVKTVCRTLGHLLKAVVSLFKGVLDIGVGLVSLDFGRVWKGIVEAGIAVVEVFEGVRGVLGVIGGVIWGWAGVIGAIVIGGIIDHVGEETTDSALRRHVRALLNARYAADPATLGRIKEALETETGVFGLRLKGSAFISRLDSTTPDGAHPPGRLLRTLHQKGVIDLYVLAGTRSNESATAQLRPDARITSLVVTGGAGGPVPPSEKEIEDYLNGDDGVTFEIYSMHRDDLESDISCLRDKFRTLGLIIDDWAYLTVELKDPRGVHLIGGGAADVVRFLREVMGRPSLMNDAPGALASTCVPIVVSVFPYDPLKTNGVSPNTVVGTCVADGVTAKLPANDACGASFRDRSLPYVYRWTPGHELGHTFGLCHPHNGVDRMMYFPGDSDPVGWRTLYTYLAGGGEPSFTLDEAKAVWNHLVRDMPATVLWTRP